MSAVESKLLKYAKILGLGKFVVAFHGALLPLSLSFFISGCSGFSDNRIKATEKVNTRSKEYKEMLSAIIANRYQSEFMRYDSAEKAYKEYLLSKRQEPQRAKPD